MREKGTQVGVFFLFVSRLSLSSLSQETPAPSQGTPDHLRHSQESPRNLQHPLASQAAPRNLAKDHLITCVRKRACSGLNRAKRHTSAAKGQGRQGSSSETSSRQGKEQGKRVKGQCSTQEGENSASSAQGYQCSLRQEHHTTPRGGSFCMLHTELTTVHTATS